MRVTFLQHHPHYVSVFYVVVVFIFSVCFLFRLQRHKREERKQRYSVFLSLFLHHLTQYCPALRFIKSGFLCPLCVVIFFFQRVRSEPDYKVPPPQPADVRLLRHMDIQYLLAVMQFLIKGTKHLYLSERGHFRAACFLNYAAVKCFKIHHPVYHT